MEVFAWRGVVRVILPKTVVPTSGRRGPVGREMLVVDVLDCLEVEGVVIWGPAMLAKRLGPWMWVPGPGLLELMGPNSWPGRAMGVFDIFFFRVIGLVSWLFGLVSRNKEVWIDEVKSGCGSWHYAIQ